MGKTDRTPVNFYPRFSGRGGKTILPDWWCTKIVCNMGPACAGEVLPRLMAAGMKVARLNLSHGSREENIKWISRFLGLSDQLQTPAAIPGAGRHEVHIGEVSGGEMRTAKIFLRHGQPRTPKGCQRRAGSVSPGAFCPS